MDYAFLTLLHAASGTLFALRGAWPWCDPGLLLRVALTKSPAGLFGRLAVS